MTIAPKTHRNHTKDEFKWKGNTVVKVKRSANNNITFDDQLWHDEKIWNDQNIWSE